MRILVTGAAGFLGSHLCDALLARGDDVIGLDNLFSGSRENLPQHPRFDFVRADVCDSFHFEADVIFNAACPASPRWYQRNPARTIETSFVGTWNALKCARACGARMVQFSTSEVYGSPAVSPQREDYWGHVNPVGERACYDEGKRAAETLCVAFNQQYGVDVRIARIFNSILADEQVLYDDGRELRRESIAKAADRLGLKLGDIPLRGIRVPSYSADGGAVSAEAAWLVAHPPKGKCYEVSTRYGRSVRVTADHSIFVRGKDGRPVAKPVADLTIGEHVAVVGRVDVPSRDRAEIDVLGILRDKHGPMDVFVEDQTLAHVAWEKRQIVKDAMADSMRRTGTDDVAAERYAWSEVQRRHRLDSTSLWALGMLGLGVPEGIRLNTRHGRSTLPAKVPITDDLLWFLGLYVAEGCLGRYQGEAVVTISSDEEYVDRADAIVRRVFGLHTTRVMAAENRAPSLRVSSGSLVSIMESLGFDGNAKRIPGWILGLPLERLGHFLEGYRCGDGVHSGKKLTEGKRHEFSTTSKDLRDDLIVAFARFALVPAVGRYETNIEKRYPGRRYPFYRLTLCNVSPWSPLQWHKGVTQSLNAKRTGDLVWAAIDGIEEVEPTSLVYDFTVPGLENFYAGTGIMCHNTYGPRLAQGDGRVVSNFIVQALRGERLTVYGDGSQTRSFCYVSDLIDGLLALAKVQSHRYRGVEIVNLGNPDERTILDVATSVAPMCGAELRIENRGLPQDDPPRRCPDITRARELLKWEPRVSFEEGISRTVEWFRGRVKGEEAA